MDEYESLSHTRWECKYHVVFIPKYRRKTLYGELRRHLGEVLRKLAVQMAKLGPLIDLDAIREQQGVEDRLPVTERTGAKQDERGCPLVRGAQGRAGQPWRMSGPRRAAGASVEREKPTGNTPDLLDQRPRGGRPCIRACGRHWCGFVAETYRAAALAHVRPAPRRLVRPGQSLIFNTAHVTSAPASIAPHFSRGGCVAPRSPPADDVRESRAVRLSLWCNAAEDSMRDGLN
jgi:hypothetical protein